MTLNRSAIALLAALTTAASAQTAAPTKPAIHHTTTAKSATAANTKDSPPGVPKIVGTPKPLYALRYVDTHIGTGPLAEPTVLGTSPADSKVMQYTVRYTGWLTDGTKFDSSYDHPEGAPFPFPVGLRRVIPGWDTGFTGMHIGGKRRLFIPWQLAYGEKGKPPIPEKADLIFDIELVSQEDITSQLVRRSAPQQAPSQTNPQSAPQTPPSAPPAGSPPPASQPSSPAQPSSPPQPATPPHPESN